MSIPLVTVLDALQVVPSVIALASGVKDAGTKGVLIAGAIVAGALALEPYVGALADLLGGRTNRILALAAAVLGVISAVRVPERIIATLTATAGCLLALTGWRVVG